MSFLGRQKSDVVYTVCGNFNCCTTLDESFRVKPWATGSKYADNVFPLTH